MTTLSSLVTLNVPSGSQTLSWGNPTTLDSITFGSNLITFPAAASYTLSQSDFALFFSYKVTFFNALLVNFPSCYQAYQIEIPASKYDIQSLTVVNLLNFLQTTGTPSPVNVFNISFDRGTKNATFAARPNPVTISLSEYLISFPVLQLYATQVRIA